ncbi:MAG: ABC transporter substrate-binding protein [Deltaproteobacteria bacterium]|nr:ABC transporter substrate-binding protein [Deltaproteobacteria bacterium]
MKKMLLMVVVLATSLTLATYGNECKAETKTAGPKRGGVLTVSQFTDPFNLNPMFHKADLHMNRIAYNLYDPLVDWDFEKKKLVPALAIKWYQKDPKTWIFKLRKGVQFHKGYGELTAEDVAFTVNYIIRKKTPSKFLFDFVKEAVVIDKYTVQYNLEQPHAPFLLSAASGIAGRIVSKKAFEEKGVDAFNRDPVGTGPYEFVEWVPADHITIKRFEGYWEKGKPYIDKIIWKTVPAVYTAQTMLRTGQIDFLPDPNFKDIKRLKKQENLEVQSTGGANWDYITFDCAKSPFDKKEVRQAIGYAIDRQAIVDAVYYGWADPDDDPLPSGYLGADPDIQVYPNRPDIAKAKELLTKAGYPNGFETTIITSAKENLRRATQIVAEQLKKIGINVKVEQLDQATYVKRVRGASDFKVELEDIGIMSMDPDSTFWWFHHSGTVRMHGHENPTTDKLLEQGRIEQDPVKRASIYQDITRQILEESPYVYIAHVSAVNVYNKALKGYKITPLGNMLMFKDTWLDQ